MALQRVEHTIPNCSDFKVRGLHHCDKTPYTRRYEFINKIIIHQVVRVGLFSGSFVLGHDVEMKRHVNHRVCLSLSAIFDAIYEELKARNMLKLDGFTSGYFRNMCSQI